MPYQASCGMQGINRFGKAPAKPGTLRPTDPNRFKTEDFFSVDDEADPEYIRRVVEVRKQRPLDVTILSVASKHALSGRLLRWR